MGVTDKHQFERLPLQFQNDGSDDFWVAGGDGGGAAAYCRMFAGFGNVQVGFWKKLVMSVMSTAPVRAFYMLVSV